MSREMDSQVDLSGRMEKSEDGNLGENVGFPSYDASEHQLPLTSRNSSLVLPHPQRHTIPHEMIVAYLYQQQRSRLWISDNDSAEEGAFMRESWSHYVTAPVVLSGSLLAEALIDLNAEVSDFAEI